MTFKSLLFTSNMFKNKEIFNLAKAYDYLLAYSTITEDKIEKINDLINDFKLYSDELYDFLSKVDKCLINVDCLNSHDLKQIYLFQYLISKTINKYRQELLDNKDVYINKLLLDI